MRNAVVLQRDYSTLLLKHGTIGMALDTSLDVSNKQLMNRCSITDTSTA